MRHCCGRKFRYQTHILGAFIYCSFRPCLRQCYISFPTEIYNSYSRRSFVVSFVHCVLFALLESILAWFRRQKVIIANHFFFSNYGLIQAAKYDWEYNSSNKQISPIFSTPEIHLLLPRILVVVQSSSSVNSKCDAH